MNEKSRTPQINIFIMYLKIVLSYNYLSISFKSAIEWNNKFISSIKKKAKLNSCDFSLLY